MTDQTTRAILEYLDNANDEGVTIERRIDTLMEWPTGDLRKAAREHFGSDPDGTTWTAFARKHDTACALASDTPRHDLNPKSDAQPPDMFGKQEPKPVPFTMPEPAAAPRAAAPATDAAALGEMILNLAGGAGMEAKITKAIDSLRSENAGTMDAIRLDVATAMMEATQHVEGIESAMEAKVRQLVEARLPRVVTFKIPNREPVRIENAHPMFETYAKASTIGTVALTGPAGSGKTTAAVKLAEATGRECTVVSVGAQTSKSDIFGYTNAAGEYVSSAVYRALTEGHILLLDEFDACNPGVSKQMNAILDHDSRTVEFPAGKIEKAEGFQCTVAMNTTGRGPDRVYLSGRPQDGSSLDRMVWIRWDYDKDLEDRLALAQGADEAKTLAWISTVEKLRAAVLERAMHVVIGTRAKIIGARLLAVGFSPKEVLNIKVFNGLGEDEVETLRAAL